MEERQFPTPEMIAAREKLAKMTPEEREALRQTLRESLKRHSGTVRWMLQSGIGQDEKKTAEK